MSRRALALLLAAAVAGCATPAPRPDTALSGRLAVRVASEPVRSVSAAFELSGNALQGRLTLTSPLGQVLVQAQWSSTGARLITPDGQTQHPDLDALAEAALGERMPMAALLDWLHGRPWGGAPSTPLAAPGSGFSQLGWHIDLARRADGWVLARRELPAPEVTVRARMDTPVP